MFPGAENSLGLFWIVQIFIACIMSGLMQLIKLLPGIHLHKIFHYNSKIYQICLF